MFIIRRTVSNVIYGYPLYSPDSNIYEQTTIMDVVENYDSLISYFNKLIEINSNLKYIQEIFY